jgi:hypothetical protein
MPPRRLDPQRHDGGCGESFISRSFPQLSLIADKEFESATLLRPTLLRADRPRGRLLLARQEVIRCADQGAANEVYRLFARAAGPALH